MLGTSKPMLLQSSCACGTCGVEATVIPVDRFVCHCLFCQTFTGMPFSDVTIFRAKDVAIKNPDNLSFKKYRWLPPRLNRGHCSTCGKPVVELSGSGLFALVFIPSNSFSKQELLPVIQRHTFYHRRIRDADDHLPKHSSFLSSQLVLIKMSIHTLLR